MSAVKLAKQKGFKYVEVDVGFTSDNIPVLLHDDTINRTARNTDGTELSASVSISSITYAEASSYDYGVWFDKGEISRLFSKDSTNLEGTPVAFLGEVFYKNN